MADVLPANWTSGFESMTIAAETKPRFRIRAKSIKTITEWPTDPRSLTYLQRKIITYRRMYDICELLERGMPTRECAKMVGLSVAYVRYLRRMWKYYRNEFGLMTADQAIEWHKKNYPV